MEKPETPAPALDLRNTIAEGLYEFFELGGTDGSSAFMLTLSKHSYHSGIARACDFEVFSDSLIEEAADFIMAKVKEGR